MRWNVHDAGGLFLDFANNTVVGEDMNDDDDDIDVSCFLLLDA